MKIGDKVTLTSIGTNNYAKGICKLDSLLVFTDDLYEGEEAIVEITDIKKNLAFGKVSKLLKKAPFRIDSECAHEDLSSCPFSDITIEAELEIKKKMIMSNFNRALELNLKDIEIESGDLIEGYRNKVTLFFNRINGKIVIGNFKEESNDFEEVKSCVQIKDIFMSIGHSLSSLLDKYEIEVCDFKKKEGNIKGLSLRMSEYTKSISVVILSRHDEEKIYDIARELKKEYKEITGVSLSINDSFDTFIYSGEEKQYYGDSFIEEKFNDIILKASNKSFLQVNTSCASKLYKEGIEKAELNKNDIVLDLYSGCGGIGLTAAKYVKHVYSIETVRPAVELAKKNALINKIDNIDFYCMDALRFDEVIKNKKVNVVFVDPPRAGLDKKVIDKLLSTNVERIVYISCDSFTQARDIKLLSEKYEIKSIKAFNMFPRTKHVENIIGLCLKEN